ncbi:MAG: sugar phosphate isomerase/epimerase [Ruminococcaceae bacterium]|nr:sugar phosphate isomerase/epimerase [Oscillospiraceae bacterium]
MARFTLSAFADEIDPNFEKQISGVKECGINFIEIRGVNGKNISQHSLDEVKEIKKILDKENVKISSIGSPIGKIKITDPIDEHIVVFKNILEMTKILETKYIRLFSFFMPANSCEKNRDEVLKRMDMLVKCAKDYDVILLHENEKDIYGDTPLRCKDIIESISSPKLKAVFDPANFVQCDCNVFPDAYNIMAPYIEYMHIKDALSSDKTVVPAGCGDGKIKEVLSHLKEKNYEGFLSLEPHLASFVGLSQLEGGHKSENETSNNLDKFHIAHDALNKILEEI